MRKKIILLSLFLSIFLTSCSNLFEKTIINKLNERINQFNDKLELSNQFCIGLNVIVNDVYLEQKMKIQKDPMYIEFEENNLKNIIAPEGDDLYTYIKDDIYIDRNYVGKMESIDLDSQIEIDYKSLYSIDFDNEKFRFFKIGNDYKMIGTYKDYLGDANFELIEEVFASYGLSTEKIGEETITTFFTFDDDGSMTIAMDIVFNKYEYTYLTQDLCIYVGIKIYFEQFTPINPLDSSYIISTPRRIEEIYEDTQLSLINKSEKGARYYRVDLKKGILVCTTDTYGLFVGIVDENGKSIYPPYSIKTHYSFEMNGMSYVPDDGVYYLLVSGDEERAIKIENYVYDNVFNAPLIMNENSKLNLELEGKYDFEVIRVNKKEGYKSIKITNRGNEPFLVDGGSYYSASIINPGETKYFPLGKDVVDYYIMQERYSTSPNQITNHQIEIDYFVLDMTEINTISEVNVSKPFEISSKKGIVYAYLEEGHYYVDYYSNYNMQFYDSEGKELFLGIIDKNINGRILGDYFIIPENAYYYIKFSELQANYKPITLRKLEYDTLIDLSYPKIPNIGGENNVGVIEGYLDIDNYYLENDSEEVKTYQIQNTGEEKICIYTQLEETPEYLLLWRINSGNYINISLSPHSNIIIYLTSETSVNYPLTNYSFIILEV